MKKHLVVLSGAGISAESGISTFRDSGGLWEGHDITEVASPLGWKRNPSLVLDFYNKRRRQLMQVKPNPGHLELAKMEKEYRISIITQNVDNLHEKAGSSNVLHLHGELTKVRSERDENYVLDWHGDLQIGDCDPGGCQLRPHIVWFGESVPAMEEAINLATDADYFAVIGTSMQVYPAAGLIQYAPESAKLFYIDPRPAQIHINGRPVEVIAQPASTGIRALFEKLKSM
jgi:NAD-dependent deacetylase